MPGPPPDDQRVRRAPPERPWKHAPASGWQHGRTPRPPDDLTPAAAEAWRVWFGAWWAAFWSPDDLPGLRLVVRLYDQVERGEFVRSPELRMTMDAYGLTPKGRQSLRWRPPLEEERRPATPRRAGLSTRDRMRILAADEMPPNGNGAA